MLKKNLPSGVRKLLRRCAIILGAAMGALLVLVVALALALPWLLSSGYGRGLAQTALSRATGRQVSIAVLDFGWGLGLRLAGLRIGTGDPASPEFLASIEEARVVPSVPALLRKDLRLKAEVRGLRLRVPHAPDEPTPPLAETLRKAYSLLRATVGHLDTGIDAHLELRLEDGLLRLEPAPGGIPILLRDIAVLVTCEGLAQSPLRVTASLGVAPALAAGQVVPAKLRLDASVKDLAEGPGRLLPAKAVLDLRLDGPGVECRAGGSLDQGLSASLRADLEQVQRAFGGLAPAPLPAVRGSTALSVSIKRGEANKVHAQAALFVDLLRVSGASARGPSLGPVSLNLLQEASLDLAAGSAELPGRLELRPSSAAPSALSWSGGLDRLDDPRPTVFLRVQPSRIDFAGLLPALRASLPPGIKAARAELALDALELSSELPEPGGRGAVSLKARGLAFEADGLTLPGAKGDLALKRVALHLHTAEAALPASGGGQARLACVFEADGLRLGGATPIALDRLRLPDATIRLDNAALAPLALHGLSGRATLELDASVLGLSADGRAEIPRLEASLRALVHLPEAKQAALSLESLSMDAPRVLVRPSGSTVLAAPLRLAASLRRAEFDASGLRSAEGGEFSATVGDALRCDARGGIVGRELRADGHLALEAGRALALTAPLLPAGLKATGAAALDWRVEAALPAPPPAGSASAPPTPAHWLKALDALRLAEATLRLDGLDVELPTQAAGGGPGEPLRLRGLSTPSPLTARLRQGLREASVNGVVAFGPVDTLPGLGRLATPLRGQLTLKATQQGGRSAQLTETLRLEGLGLDQQLSLNVDRLDTLKDRADLPATVLELLDGGFSFHATADLSDLARLPALGDARSAARALSGAGKMELHADGRLSSGRSLALAARFSSPGLDLRLGPDLAVERLAGDLRLARRYRLSRGLACPAEDPRSETPLSEQVFDLFPERNAGADTQGASALGQLLRPSEAPSASSGRQRSAETAQSGGWLRLGRVRLKSGPLPLDIRDLELRIDDSGPLPGLKSFRAGLLGGDMLGGLALRRSGGRYSLHADLGFTGVDPSRLLPDKARALSAEETEASGRLSLTLPLTPDPEELLRRLSLRADITRIGPRTLERMLYALDPEERNETIVQQRRLMGIGHPERLRLAVDYGNLSLGGAVRVKGMRLDLPAVDRLPVANLPLRDKLARPLSAMPEAIRMLDSASGSHLCRDAAGRLRAVAPASTGGSR